MRPSPILVVLALVGCHAATVPGDPPPMAAFRDDLLVRAHMQQNFDLLRAIERLLIRGELGASRRLAYAIGNAPDAPVLGPWAHHTTRVRDLANALAEAPSLDEACRREARLAVACAGCHVEAGVTPEFLAASAVPPDGATVDARMARHLWATDRLWEAIVGGGDEPWQQGLAVLAETPAPVDDPSDVRVRLARQLQQLAARTRQSPRPLSHAERGRAYGEILIVCAGCHGAAVAPMLPSPP